VLEKAQDVKGHPETLFEVEGRVPTLVEWVRDDAGLWDLRELAAGRCWM
jgi:hypothetical protein